MLNYTRYELKSPEELAPVMDSTDRVFVLACNKCFKEFVSAAEPEGEEMVRMLEERGRIVTGLAEVDFLCNKTQTLKRLEIPEGTQSVFVVSCGLGVQTIADAVTIPVFAAADSLNYRGHHGMALTEKTCGACAQCYLNVTGGICPVGDCSKSLLNGQCGGAKNGKCEVDPDRDCAWEKIEQRLAEQGRLQEFLGGPVQIRDYARADHRTISEFVRAARESRADGYYGGVHPAERKELSADLPLVRFPEPDVAVIPLSMHAGAPAEPVVAPGDKVKVGQKIGAASAFISANVHSSVSGTVLAVEPRPHPTRNGGVLSVVIRNDGKNETADAVRPHGSIEELTPEEIVEIVRECGITGMGGAGFPTSVKLAPNKPIDAVLLNGCECEPMLTADHRVLLEYADDVIFGLRAMMKAVSAPKGIIVIEDNKPDAIGLLRAKTENMEGIGVVSVRTKYPQGAEKMLIKRVLGRQVPSGRLPADVGAVVCNVSTSKAVADAVRTGMPLIERAVTVTGERIGTPGNFIVRIGTPVRELIERCGGVTGDNTVLKTGGPMMGAELTDTDVPVIKGTNGVIACAGDRTEPVSCIKCGRCVDVCPMELKPLYFAKYHDEGNWQGMKDMDLLDCIECRCCEYICPSKIPIVTKIKAGKSALREMNRK